MSQTTPPAAPGMSPRRAAPIEQPPAFVASGGRQRRWSLALVAVLVTVGSALAFVVLWLNAGDRRPYLAVAENISQGQTIEADQLTTVRISVDPTLSPIPASQRDAVVGQVAKADMVAGSLLVEGAVGEEEGLERNMAIVGLPVDVDRLPTPLPQSGDTVRVFSTGVDPDIESENVQSYVIADARVLGSEEVGDKRTFTLLVRTGEAQDIAAVAEAGGAHVAIVNPNESLPPPEDGGGNQLVPTDGEGDEPLNGDESQ